MGRGQDIAEDALDLGAHVYIDIQREEPAKRLQALGGAQALVTSFGDANAVAALLPGLAPQGRLIVLGAGKDPLPVALGPLVVGERSVVGSITGTPWESERTLDFSVLVGVRPRIETLPFTRAMDAYKRLKSGDVKFRLVLTM
jgi:alcohol dehydrogenase